MSEHSNKNNKNELPIKAETAKIPAHEIAQQAEDAVKADEAAKQANLPAWLIKIANKMDAINNWLAPKAAENEEATPTDLARRPILVGAWMMILVFGLLGIWSAVAPLSSAAIAPGKVILSGSRKTVQHFEGGIVEKILVREGQTVKAGEELIRLNETAARARLDLFRNQYLSSLATQARLVAERDGLDEITYPEELTKEPVSEVIEEITTSQRRLFKSRRKAMQGEKNILEQKKKQFDQEINGLNSQIRSASEQIRLLGEEIRAVKTLLAQGNAQKPRLLALQRAQADLQGQRGEYKAAISRAKQAISEAEIQILNLESNFANKVAGEIKDNIDKIADLNERLKASTDIIDRIIITAPLAGIVTGLQVHTIGGVIQAGARLLDIVPIDDLLVEASVAPQDIDVVRVGLPARVMLSAYKARNVPPLEGIVLQVSPDRYEDPNTGVSYYPTRIRILETELAQYKDIELTPGMPADALIVTGERTLLSYLMTPITDSFRKAFREE